MSQMFQNLWQSLLQHSSTGFEWAATSGLPKLTTAVTMLLSLTLIYQAITGKYATVFNRNLRHFANELTRILDLYQASRAQIRSTVSPLDERSVSLAL